MEDRIVNSIENANETVAATREGEPLDKVSDEMGYLFLRDCFVKVIEKNISRRNEFVVPGWVDVSLICDEPDDEEAKAIVTSARESREAKGEDEICSVCDLVFHEGEVPILSPSSRPSSLGQVENEKKSSSSIGLYLMASTAGRFSGILSDVTGHNNSHNINRGTTGMPQPLSPQFCSDASRRRKRSDASLMMGLALTCQDEGHATIRRVRVLFWEERRGLCSSDDSRVRDGDFSKSFSRSGDGGGRETSSRRLRRCSLVISLSFPHIILKTANISIMPFNSRKPLPPSTQLLLSVVRSDWDFLDKEMAKMEKEFETNGSSQPEFFPSKLSLDELYMRIPKYSGVSLLHDQYEMQVGQINIQSRNSYIGGTSLVDLPHDILRSSLAPFLKAKSLDAFRCTCKYMHGILQFVVPGMRLRLYQHQIKSLKWMRMREVSQITESDFLCNNKSNVCQKNVAMVSLPDGDGHRAITGGKSVLLRNRSKEENIRIDQLTGRPISQLGEESAIINRKFARGGLLCDDPGLGKTITVLSLILQTMGLSTETEKPLSKLSNSPCQSAIFQVYWKEEITSDFQEKALLKLMGTLYRNCSYAINYFEHPVNPDRDRCPDYFQVIKHPMCLSVIKKKIGAGDYGGNFDAFESDVQLCFRNAIEYNPPEHEVHEAARIFLKTFAYLVEEFKENQIISARKSFSNATAKPNCSVAALLEEEFSQMYLKALVPSSTTLLVIPRVLMEHWQEQIARHVNLSYFTDKIPIIYEYKKPQDSALDEIVFKCKIKNTHSPIIFVDKGGTKKLPSPDFLAMFKLVITSTQRFTNEFKNGSFQDELKQQRYYNEEPTDYKQLNEEAACPLLKVNWLRVIVDEGHSMGRGNSNCAIRFASWITAQRRWAVTGTPTRQTVSQNGLFNLLCLMGFLQNDFFTARLSGDEVWRKLIAKSWNEECVASFFRLRSLLSLLMVRHTKLDIEELPTPRYKISVVPMSPVEVTTYNTLVCAVQSNIIITSMEAKTSGGQDSLLHRSQAPHARKALSNIRLACSGGTRVVPTLSDKFRREFIEECEKLLMPEYKIEELKGYLHRAETEQLSQCLCCGILLSTLLVLPCGDLLCTECMDSKSTVCVICEQPFDADEFQILQPGMDYQWKWNLEEEKATIKARAMDIPTLNHGALDGEIDNNILALEDGNNDNIRNIRPIELGRQRRRRKPGDGHMCEYDQISGTGKCIDCLAEHNSCKLINKKSRCEVCHRRAEDCPKEEAKATYIVDKLLKLYEIQKGNYSPGMSTDCESTIGGEHRDKIRSPVDDETIVKLDTARPLKVIIFSQFRKSLNFVGDRLLRRFGTACVAEYWGSFRSEELHKFTHESDCFCMLLGKDGSEGLDLSFVTHIFFLEAVWDKSLENQVVARAWRMGAEGRVDVETLVAQSSVEEQMWKLERMLSGQILEKEFSREEHIGEEDIKGIFSAVECSNGSNYLRTKVHFLLKNLQLIKRPNIIPLMRRGTMMSKSGEKRPSPSFSPTTNVSCNVGESRKKRKTSRIVQFHI